MAAATHSLRDELFAGGGKVFAILDGASIPGLLEKLYENQPEHVCLYRGELDPDLATAAPYLVRMDAGSPFAQWVMDQGWGNHWGIFAMTDADLLALRQHFRRFLMVHDEEGNPIYFRYYDPRVLRVYLPTCNGEELGTIFGPVREYLTEGESASHGLRFRFEGGALQRKEIPLKTK